MPDISSGWIQFIQFIVNLLILGGVGIWRLAQTEQDLINRFTCKIEEHKKEVTSKMSDINEEHSETQRWVLEQFVRREDLRSAIDQINIALAGIRQSFDARMDRIEGKLDNLNKR